MSFSAVKKELSSLNKEQLIALIGDLYKFNKSCKEYLDHFGNPDEKRQFEKCKQKVFEAFYPKRGPALKLMEARQAISEFKKLGPSAALLADVMLYYVECGVEFTIEFGDINEAFYSSIENMYRKTLELINKENLLEKFRDRSQKIVNDTEEIGWGFHDYLAGEHYEYYPEP